MTDSLDVHLKELEQRLFDPAIRSSREELTKLLSVDFREIGSSGRIFGFEEIVAALAEPETEAVRSLEDFTLQGLADNLALATYRATRVQPGNTTVRTFRSSLWRRDDDGLWRMVFHQGTPIR
ncbi:MAG: DUF4440 domain-containing protein [Rhizobiaceae bacterium]|nr:DUF4440 domain-containing protein [Rhizobiaceae bacterium]